jgi:hypothetical protein
MNKSTAYYFESAKTLPLAMSLVEVQALVAKVGVPPNPPKSGWNFKNFTIMTVSIITISTALLLAFGNTSESKYMTRNSILIQENQEGLISPIKTDSTRDKKTKTVQIIDEKGDTHFVEVKKIGKKTFKEVEESNIELIEPTIKLIGSDLLETSSINFEEPSKGLFGLNDASLFTSKNKVGIMDSKIEPFELFSEPEELIDSSGTAQINGSEKKINKTLDVGSIDWFKLSNKRGNVKIKTWNKNEVNLLAKITMEGKTKEDEAIGLKDFDLDLVKKGKYIQVENNWDGEETGTCFCWSDSKKNKIKTSTGETIKIKKIKIEYEVTVPENFSLDIKSSYADLNIDDIEGEVIVSVFKGDFNANKIGGDLTLTTKYGGANINSFPNGNVVFFKANGKLGSSKELNLKANYSDYEINQTENLKLNAFQSDGVILNAVNEIEGSIRYGELDLNADLNKTELSLFQAKLKGKAINEATISSSYSEIKAAEVGDLNLLKAFQSNVAIDEVNTIEGKANYTPIMIENLISKLSLTTFQGSLDVTEIGETFSMVDINAKYTKLTLMFNPNSKYHFEAETNYTGIDLPESKMSLSFTENRNSSSKLKGDFNSNENENQSTVKLNCFQGKLDLK